jgi:hypothetical protein
VSSGSVGPGGSAAALAWGMVCGCSEFLVRWAVEMISVPADNAALPLAQVIILV